MTHYDYSDGLTERLAKYQNAPTKNGHSSQYYGLNTVQNRKSMVKDAIWTCSKHEVHF